MKCLRSKNIVSSGTQPLGTASFSQSILYFKFQKKIFVTLILCGIYFHSIHVYRPVNDDNKFRFNDASIHEGHLRQHGVLTWFGIETAIMVDQYIVLWYRGRQHQRDNSR